MKCKPNLKFNRKEVGSVLNLLKREREKISKQRESARVARKKRLGWKRKRGWRKR